MPQTSYIVATPQGPQFADTGFFLSDVMGNRYPTDKERLENHPGLTQTR